MPLQGKIGNIQLLSSQYLKNNNLTVKEKLFRILGEPITFLLCINKRFRFYNAFHSRKFVKLAISLHLSINRNYYVSLDKVVDVDKIFSPS